MAKTKARVLAAQAAAKGKPKAKAKALAAKKSKEALAMKKNKKRADDDEDLLADDNEEGGEEEEDDEEDENGLNEDAAKAGKQKILFAFACWLDFYDCLNIPNEMVGAGRKALFQPIGSRRKGRGKITQHSQQTHAANSVRLVSE